MNEEINGVDTTGAYNSSVGEGVSGGQREGTSIPESKGNTAEKETESFNEMLSYGDDEVSDKNHSDDNENSSETEKLENDSKIAELQKQIEILRSNEILRLGPKYEAFIVWVKKRERLEPEDPLFYVYEESYRKALVLIEPLKPYIDFRIYDDVLYSAGLHYIIVEDYKFENTEGLSLINPLYLVYNIAAKGYIISSASDESSSSSIHVTKSLQDGDFMMQDLLRTKYGTFVYTILEQLDIGSTLL